MGSRAHPGSVVVRARFAVRHHKDIRTIHALIRQCDFCQEKKLKCSRELPKCLTCKPWPGSCEYSRDRLAPLPDLSNLRNEEPKAGSVESRLDRVELTLQSLTNSVNQILETVKTANTTALHRGGDARRRDTSNRISKEPQLFIGPSHSFSMVKDALSNLEGLGGGSSASVAEHRDARERLRDLSAAMATTVVGAQCVEEEDTRTGFHVPTKPIGYGYISRFLQVSELGEAMFLAPPDELLMQVVFHPDKVHQKAWVVFFNYVMLASVSLEPSQAESRQLFRRNTHLALNDSKVFLEPNEVNIQALVMLAMHGEDFASPNSSWMLAGHACRQAQALGLHLATDSDYNTQQRRLFVFWMLFLIDKCCALAFGRPVFLPSSLYWNVPYPDSQYLLKFQPHNTDFFNAGDKARSSTFGAQLIGKGFELAKMIGRVLDSLAAQGEISWERKTLRSELDDWYLQTNQVLSSIMDAEKASLNPAQLREMTLGIRSMKFYHLHILILLSRDDSSQREALLSAAREAISILPSIVSNWVSVYNGMVWQLLYYPFTPFFVIFGSLIRDPRAGTAYSDLALLGTTVSYFASMRSQLNLLVGLSSKLERVASVFAQLARSQVLLQGGGGHSGPAAPGNSTSSSSGVPGYTTETILKPNQARIFSNYGRLPGLGQEVGTGSVPPTISPLAAIDLSTIEVAGDVDIASYLDWLPSDASLWDSREEVGVGEYGYDSVFGTPRGRKRPFDSTTFDWFSWDAYYSGAESGG